MARSARAFGRATLFGSSASGRALALRSSLAHRASPARPESNADARPTNIARCHGACAAPRVRTRERDPPLREGPRSSPGRTHHARGERVLASQHEDAARIARPYRARVGRVLAPSETEQSMSCGHRGRRAPVGRVLAPARGNSTCRADIAAVAHRSGACSRPSTS